METAGGTNENASDEDEKTSPPVTVREVDGRFVVNGDIVTDGSVREPCCCGARIVVQEPVQVSADVVPCGFQPSAPRPMCMCMWRYVAIDVRRPSRTSKRWREPGSSMTTTMLVSQTCLSCCEIASLRRPRPACCRFIRHWTKASFPLLMSCAQSIPRPSSSMYDQVTPWPFVLRVFLPLLLFPERRRNPRWTRIADWLDVTNQSTVFVSKPVPLESEDQNVRRSVGYDRVISSISNVRPCIGRHIHLAHVHVLHRFVRCLDTENIEHSLDTSPNSQFHQCCMAWQHPSLPWVDLIHRGPRVTIKESTGNIPPMGANPIFKESLFSHWIDSFRSLFQVKSQFIWSSLFKWAPVYITNSRYKLFFVSLFELTNALTSMSLPMRSRVLFERQALVVTKNWTPWCFLRRKGFETFLDAKVRLYEHVCLTSNYSFLYRHRFYNAITGRRREWQ